MVERSSHNSQESTYNVNTLLLELQTRRINITWWSSGVPCYGMRLRIAGTAQNFSGCLPIVVAKAQADFTVVRLGRITCQVHSVVSYWDVWQVKGSIQLNKQVDRVVILKHLESWFSRFASRHKSQLWPCICRMGLCELQSATLLYPLY